MSIQISPLTGQYTDAWGMPLQGMPSGGSGFNFNLGSQQADPNAFGMNLNTGKFALGALQGLGNLWSAFEGNKLAKKQFDFTKNFANINLANQTQTYNTHLSDMARSRGFTEGQSQGQIDSYVAANKLKDQRV